MSAVLSNGSREAATQRAKEGASRKELEQEFGISNGLAGIIRREAGATRGTKSRSAAQEAVPVAAANSAREASPPVRSSARTTSSLRKARLDDRWLRVAAVAVATIVGIAAFAMSYDYISRLAAMAGLGWHAWLMPLALDGLVGSATFAIVRGKALVLAWISMALAGIGSVTANVFAAAPELVDLHHVEIFMAGFVPIVFAVCVELVICGLRQR